MAQMTSRVKWLQELIEKIQSIKAPAWFVALMADVQEAVVLAFYNFTKAEIEAIKAKIAEVAKLDIEGWEKFDMVFDFCKQEFKDKKDSILNVVINALYLTLKAKF